MDRGICIRYYFLYNNQTVNVSVFGAGHLQKQKNCTHVFDGTGPDGNEHVGQVEEEVPRHHSPLYLAERFVPLQV